MSWCWSLLVSCFHSLCKNITGLVLIQKLTGNWFSQIFHQCIQPFCSLLFSCSVCLKGVKIHGKCLLADPVRKSYHTASEDCNALGGVLSTPTSSEENNQIIDYIRQSIGPDEQVWLGINDMMTEGAWMDQTGSSITFKNWDTSNSRSPQPDGRQSENCAVLSLASRGKWFDENCREDKSSVCQFNIVWSHLSNPQLRMVLAASSVYPFCNTLLCLLLKNNFCSQWLFSGSAFSDSGPISDPEAAG